MSLSMKGNLGMTEEERDLLALKGAVSMLAPDEQAKIQDAASRLREIVYESDQSMMALAIVTMEVALERAKETSR